MCVWCPQRPKEGVESRYVTEEAKAHIKMIEHTGKNIRVVESRSDPKVVVSKRQGEPEMSANAGFPVGVCCPETPQPWAGPHRLVEVLLFFLLLMIKIKHAMPQMTGGIS